MTPFHGVNGKGHCGAAKSQKADILVCTISADSEHFLISDNNANLLGTIARAPSDGRALSAMSTNPNDMTTTITNYIE